MFSNLSRVASATLAFLCLSLPSTAVEIPLSPMQYKAPDATELRATQQRFYKAIAYSYSPRRSGQLFFLPRKYASVMFQSGDYAHDGYSYIGGVKTAHTGATHGQVWDYDVEIPLLFYGPGYVKAGQVLQEKVTQQDLAPTYAYLMGGYPPEDARHGQILKAPFKPIKSAPKAILTVLFDQGGWQYYAAHPKAWPFVKSLMDQGSLYLNAEVNHVDVETAVGHVGVGTGAYPYQHGIISNRFSIPPLGERQSLLGRDQSPIFIDSPSLADTWDQQSKNEAVVISYAYADRAAIGMAGHGSMFAGGDKDIVAFYDRKTGGVTSNTQFYTLPDYLKDLRIQPFLKDIQDTKSLWFGHDINNLSDVNKTPAQAQFDTEVFLKILENEPVGQDNITDLVYLTLKSTDACGHAFGWQSDECGSVLKEQDKQLERIMKAFEAKVGKDNFVMVLSADHGGAPLSSLANTAFIKAEEVKDNLNTKFDTLDNGIPLVYDMLASQVYIDLNELDRNGHTMKELQSYLLNYRVDNEPAFLEVLNREEVRHLQEQYGIY